MRIPWNLNNKIDSKLIVLILAINMLLSHTKGATFSFIISIKASSDPFFRPFWIYYLHSTYIIICKTLPSWLIAASFSLKWSSLFRAAGMLLLSRWKTISFLILKFCLTDILCWFWLETSKSALESSLIVDSRSSYWRRNSLHCSCEGLCLSFE